MGTRCLLTQVALLLVVITTPVMSFPARSSNKQSPSHDRPGDTRSSLVRMLTDKILHLSADKGSSGGIADQKQNPTGPLGLDQFVPVWPARHTKPASEEKWQFARETQQTAADLSEATNGGDGDIFTPDVSGLETMQISDEEKRSSDYGHGMFFGKRLPSSGWKNDRHIFTPDVSGLETLRLSDEEKRSSDYGHGLFFGKRAGGGWKNRRQQGDGETRQQGLLEKRPSDYHWGLMFGKRGHTDTYGWGGFFGKRNEDVIEYDDFVA